MLLAPWKGKKCKTLAKKREDKVGKPVANLAAKFSKPNECSETKHGSCYKLELIVLKGNSQLWDRADLDTSFLTLKRVHPNLKSKYIFYSAPQCFC